MPRIAPMFIPLTALLGIVLAGYGGYCRDVSPQYEAWLSEQLAQLDVDNLTGAAMGANFIFETVCLTICTAFVLMTYNVLISYLQSPKWREWIGVRFVTVAWVLGAIFALVMTAGTVWSNLRWGFWISALGYCTGGAWIFLMISSLLVEGQFLRPSQSRVPTNA